MSVSSLLYTNYSSNPYAREIAECRWWIENPDARKKRLQEIYSKDYFCPHCRKSLAWHSDHMRFIWFECITVDCSGEQKVWL